MKWYMNIYMIIISLIALGLIVGSGVRLFSTITEPIDFLPYMITIIYALLGWYVMFWCDKK